MSVPDRFVRNKSDEAAINGGCTFNLTAAERVRTFFRKHILHGKGQFAGQPFEPLDWQWERVIAPLYGWRRPNGTRRFRRAGVAVPKKNGKSTLLAALGLYHLVADRESGAEVYTVAADKAQASIIWKEAANMVRLDEGLSELLRPVTSGKHIYDDATGSVLSALSSDVNTKEGYNSSCTMFDELHAQKGWELWNALRYAGASRRQPLLFWITTAGFDRDSLCFDEWQYARGIQSSTIIDTEFLPVIYEPDPGDDWTAESTWRKVNPSYGITISAEDMRSACEEVKRSPTKENAFKRYRLNIWTSGETKWLSEVDWKSCYLDYTEADLAGMPCISALDLSTTTDIAAEMLVFKIAGEYRLLPRFWVPFETMLRRERLNRVRFDKWVEQGHIMKTPGNVIDYSIIRKDMNDLAEMYDIQEVGIDAWNHTQITCDLIADGFKVTPVRTGFLSLSSATKEFERQVLCGKMRHNGNSAMDWMIQNLLVEQDASGNLKPSKKKSLEKIDGPVAAIIALALHIGKGEKKLSKYEKAGISYA